MGLTQDDHGERGWVLNLKIEEGGSWNMIWGLIIDSYGSFYRSCLIIGGLNRQFGLMNGESNQILLL